MLCEGMISEEECLTALKEFKNNKAPGTDGFSAEFYKFFWSDLGTQMTASFNYALNGPKNQSMPLVYTLLKT